MYRGLPSRSSSSANETRPVRRASSRAQLVNSGEEIDLEDLQAALDVDDSLLEDARSKKIKVLRTSFLRLVPYLLLILTVVLVIVVFQGRKDMSFLSQSLIGDGENSRGDGEDLSSEEQSSSGGQSNLVIRGQSRVRKPCMLLTLGTPNVCFVEQGQRFK
eukprot:TRINITY_DN20092_c0_g1_i1.p1 TRINITY_DN20092_c0_g1~~TRINITY_DN20092_c0_g1_i1.p1  ORF type:complete len:160 (-),score=12.66 TRINITY_DN20092_c0_g1_i1:5-484(-)